MRGGPPGRSSTTGFADLVTAIPTSETTRRGPDQLLTREPKVCEQRRHATTAQPYPALAHVHLPTRQRALPPRLLYRAV
jgi:hypothetical protein